MWATNLKIVGIVFGTIAVYTVIANSIPQVESEVPKALVLTGDFSPEQLVAAGGDLYDGGGGCTACHGLGTRAPHLVADEAGLGEIGARCGQRVRGEDCKTYLYKSMTDPNDFVVDGYQPIMPDMRRTLSETQIWALVAYLESRGGVVTVSADDVAASGAGDEASETPTPGMPMLSTADPVELLRELQCIACHQLGDEGAPVGPAFTDIGGRVGADYIRRSILDPGGEIAAGYEQFAGVMPTNFGERLTAAQLEAIVAFLTEQR